MTRTEQLTRRLKWCVTRIMLMFVVLISCSACNSIYDDEGDCDPCYFVRFVFDMNMLYADAFATQVKSVDLYVFDAQTGDFVTHISDKGEALTSGNYRMPLDVPPGKYQLIAWCGLADNDDHFTVPQSITKPEDLICTLTRSHDDKGAFCQENLKALFHGSLSVNLPNEEGEHTVTVKLIKDTNNIIFTLIHHAGTFDPDDYEITITDENGRMAHDNSLMADEEIEYRPWILETDWVKLQGDDTTDEADEDSDKINYMKFELATARLMTDHKMNIKVFDKKQDKTVFSTSVVKAALQYRSANYADMGYQEYLDRRDEYELTVILNDESWLNVEIYILGWKVLQQDNQFDE